MERLVAMSERQTDARLIASCQQGDREAFRQLFETYKDRVYSVALYFFGGDAAQAADITQQVFLKLFTKIAQFRSDAEFTTWLYRLTTNACVDEQRKLRRLNQFDEFDIANRPQTGRMQDERFAQGERGGTRAGGGRRSEAEVSRGDPVEIFRGVVIRGDGGGLGLFQRHGCLASESRPQIVGPAARTFA